MSLFQRFVFILMAVPVALILCLVVAFVDCVRRIAATATGPFRRLHGSKSSSPTEEFSGATPVSIIVLNWNGRSLLAQSLPALQEALRHTPRTCEVIIVDNGSSDDSLAYVKQQFPSFRIIALSRNMGFGEGNNAGVRAARYDLVLLLNNDMIVQPDFLDPLAAAMRSDTFAASSQVFLPPGARREETGKTTARIRHGRLELGHTEITQEDESNVVIQVFWAGGGSSLYRKDLFLELGGFDKLYSPSYAEDADLSFRAWQAGYRSVVAIQSHVLHKHKSSTRKRFGESGARKLMYRNICLFFLKNFSTGAICRYLFWLPANSWMNSEIKVLITTLPRWFLLLARRMGRRRPVWSEREILLRVGTPLPDCGLQIAVWGFEKSPVVRGPSSAPEPTECNPQSAICNPQLGRPLRILYVSAYVPHLWRHGGAGRVFQLIRRVAKSHEVSVATFYENEYELQECAKLRESCREVVPVYRRGKRPQNIFPYEPFEEFDLPEMHHALHRLAQRYAFDIVHFEYTQMACYALHFPDAVKFLTEVEVNYAAAASKISYLANPMRRLKWYYNSMQVLDRELTLCRQVDHVVCVNDSDAALLGDYLFERPIHVVHTGVDIDYFIPNGKHAEEPLSIGFIAAFRHEPNVDGALFFADQVFPLIKREIPDARLYLVGTSPPEEIVRLHNGKDILVTGYVENLRDYYDRISAVVVPVRTGVGIRGKILEAWAAGKPVVGTTVAAAGIEARQGENMYIADSPELLARWTVRVLQNKVARIAMGLHARRTAEEFYDWNRLAMRLDELYQYAVNKKGVLAKM